MRKKKRNGSQHSPILHPDTEEEEEPHPKKQKQLSDLPKPKLLENEIVEIPSAMEATIPRHKMEKPQKRKQPQIYPFVHIGKATKSCCISHGRWLIIAAILPSINLNR
ncbi:Uncharacterized protein Fot_19499 [Forsythia ovata]|uniref:Uncharacterized protein n=1 Tax=Forsythia ovata TaxID=205694 RepID=A0ABD1VLB2_9LAMI